MTHDFFLKPGHAYTADKLPWKMVLIENRLVRYIAGGGMMAFGRTLEQDKRERRQNRFLAWTGAITAIYLILMFI